MKHGEHVYMYQTKENQNHFFLCFIKKNIKITHLENYQTKRWKNEWNKREMFSHAWIILTTTCNFIQCFYTVAIKIDFLTNGISQNPFLIQASQKSQVWNLFNFQFQSKFDMHSWQFTGNVGLNMGCKHIYFGCQHYLNIHVF